MSYMWKIVEQRNRRPITAQTEESRVETWRCGGCGSDRFIDVRSKGKSVVYLNRRDNASLTEEDIERAIDVLKPGVGVPKAFTSAFKDESNGVGRE